MMFFDSKVIIECMFVCVYFAVYSSYLAGSSHIYLLKKMKGVHNVYYNVIPAIRSPTHNARYFDLSSVAQYMTFYLSKIMSFVSFQGME